MQDDDYDNRITEARQFLKFCNDADSNNRAEALEDILFCSGDQWPVELQNSRNLESRPVLTINKLDGFCRQVVNQIKQQRPRPCPPHAHDDSYGDDVSKAAVGLWG